MKDKEKNIPDSDLIEGIRSGDESAFKHVFLTFYAPLSSMAAEFVGSYEIGNEIVHEVFLKIWNRRETWSPYGPLKPYLFQAVCNQAINYNRKEKTRREMMELYYEDIISISNSNSTYNEVELKEMTKAIWKAVKKLPKRRYLIFIMHKAHGLSYKEIALSMEISVKTVENQMGRALKFLRQETSLKNHSD